MRQHLLFYDGDCPLCQRFIRFVVASDEQKVFLFASLQGETAKKEVAHLYLKNPSLDTLVLIEDYNNPPKRQILIEGRGAFRVLWLLGGQYRLLGWLSFLPSYLFDIGYRFVAKRRYRLFKARRPITEEDLNGRLLP